MKNKTSIIISILLLAACGDGDPLSMDDSMGDTGEGTDDGSEESGDSTSTEAGTDTTESTESSTEDETGSDETGDDGCVNGYEGCPCTDEDLCLDGLTCLSDLCVDAGGDGDGDGDGSTGDGDGESTSETGDGDGDGDGCVPSNGGFEDCDGIDNDCDTLIDENACDGCEAGSWNGSNYLFCGEQAEMWIDARVICNSYGYHLVKIETEEENTFVYDQATNITLDNRWWIGLNDQLESDVFRWIDGEVAEFTSWGTDVGWGSQQPSGDGDCVEFRTIIGDYRWNDYFCESSGFYICEMEL